MGRITVDLKAGARMPSFVIVQPSASKRIRPPKGARIHSLRVKVTLDEEWQAAINAGGPNTPEDFNVRKVADQYLPTGTGEAERELILLNYSNSRGSWDKACAWARRVGLSDTDPREVFPVGAQYTALHQVLKCDPMYVVATTDYTFRGNRLAYCVWWDGSRRSARRLWVGSFGDSSDWFAFRK